MPRIGTDRIYSMCLAVLLAAMALQNGNINTSFAQQQEGSLTFHTVIFYGVEDGEALVNTTSMTINGTVDELRQQFPQVLDWLYNETAGLPIGGPTVFLGSNSSESIVRQTEPTREDYMNHFESLLVSLSEDAPRAEQCWLYHLGGGSMHGDCPPRPEPVVLPTQPEE
jgi:hypothetical protein